MAAGSKPTVPGTPDYQSLATQSTMANRPDVITPFGNSTWNYDPQTGKWTNTNTLGQAGQDALGRLNNLPSLTQDWTAQQNTVRDALMSRLNPQMQQQQDALRQRLANQGLTPGSEAWNREWNTLNQGQNDLRLQADSTALQQMLALDANNRATRQQGYSELQAMTPQFQQYNNATTPFAAGQAQNQANLYGYGQQVGQYNNTMSGLANLFGAWAGTGFKNPFGG